MNGRAAVATKLLTGAAGAKAALAAFSLLNLHGRAWVFLAHVVVYGAAGAFLVFTQRDDRRAKYLGAFFLLIASAFAEPLLTLVPMFDADVPFVLTRLRPDAFLAWALWSFAREFPFEMHAGLPRRAARWGVGVSLGVGWFLFLASAWGSVGHAFPSLTAPAVVRLFVERPQATLFWPIEFLLALSALVYAGWRARHAAVDERRRVKLFLAGIVGGFLPMLLIVLLESASRTFAQWTLEPAVDRVLSIFIYGSFLTIPLTTAWAVLVHRALDVRLVLRRAMQYGLARWTLVGVTVAPAVALVVLVWNHRAGTVAELFSGPAILVLAVIGIAGIVAWSRRRAWLDALDRRFFREQYDARRLLASLVDQSRQAAGAMDLARLWTEQIDQALHLECLSVLVNDLEGRTLAPRTGTAPALPVQATLAKLAAESAEPMDVDLVSPRSPLRRLPESDRTWLVDAGAQLLQPLHGADGALLGLIVLGAKRSELPFTDEDRSLIAALAASGSLVLESRLMRSSEPRAAREDPRGAEPARECGSCGTIAEAASCPACGSELREGALPRLLRGRFRLERRIGAGGMSVVYRASDVDLDRAVALKVLPRLDPDRATRLRREARAMAALTHPHLAIVHGLEWWRGSPVLVLEHLDGGTLKDLLEDRPCDARFVVELGMAMASALAMVHGAHLLHRDVKPSNIGFARDRSAKLLDFGLVRMLAAASERGSADTTVTGVVLSSGSSLTGSGHVVGTLPYLSPEAVALEAPVPGFDLWSLAVTLYEALTGLQPFQDVDAAETLRRIREARVPDPRELAPECPAALADLLMKALASNPSRRPRSAQALREALAAAI